MSNPTRKTVSQAKEKGVWVFRADGPLPPSVTGDVLDQLRRDRDRNNLGQRIAPPHLIKRYES